MIIVLYGQPHSGKSTLARELDNNHYLLDGDRFREVFQDKNFTREGRIKNLNRASDIAVFMHSIYNKITLSMVYPYQEARDYLNEMCNRLGIDIFWVYLHYEGERGRESFHVKDFELDLLKENILTLNTSKESIEDCVIKIKEYVG
jgi:adenylylsulfate kinase-like enzyme